MKVYFLLGFWAVVSLAESRHVPGWSITPPPPRQISEDGQPLVFQRPHWGNSGRGDAARLEGTMVGRLQSAQWDNGEYFLLFTNSLGIKYLVNESSLNSALRSAVGQTIRVTDATIAYGNQLTILEFAKTSRPTAPPATVTSPKVSPSPSRPAMPASPISPPGTSFDDL